MANFTPLSAAIGGALIGLASVLLMLFAGRVAGIAASRPAFLASAPSTAAGASPSSPG